MYNSVACAIILGILSYWDIKCYKIPNNVVLMGTVFLVCHTVTNPFQILSYRYLNVIFFISLFYSIALLTHGLGMGDVKVMGIISFVEDFFSICTIGVIACIFGAVIFFVQKVIKHKKLTRIPFVPCLTFGFVIVEILKKLFYEM